MKVAATAEKVKASAIAPRLVLLAASLTFAFVLVEIGFRIWRYNVLLERYVQQVAEYEGGGDDPALALNRELFACSTFDPHSGYRYKPNHRVDVRPTAENLSPRRWQTNSHGHISASEYAQAKPAGEFRIAVIGDSFTAGVTNSVRWPDVLEERLKGSPAWTERVKGDTRVINFGRDGIGVVQFLEVFRTEVLAFDPDVVLVNLIVDDLPRRPYFRGRSRVSAETDVRAMVRKEVLGPLPWFGFYPECLAATGLGRRLGLTSHLEPELARYFPSEDEAMQVSLRCLREIVASHPRILILQHPQSEEYSGTLPPMHTRLRDRLYGEGADLKVVRMTDWLPDPYERSIPVTRWYQLPHDGHPSDEGMRVYGAAVSDMLVQRCLP